MSLFRLCPRDATRADAVYVAANMRAADRAELEAASGLSAFKALESDFVSSAVALCADGPSGKPFVMFGYKQREPGKAQLWMCTTDEIELPCVSRAFWRVSKSVFSELCAGFKLIYGFVDARHKVSVGWLKRLGFVFGEPFSFGANGELFYRFEKEGRRLWAL